MSDHVRCPCQALGNGAMVALGSVAVVDNVVSHWLPGLHRAVPGEAATPVEAFLVVSGVVLVTVGLRREVRQRRVGKVQATLAPTEEPGDGAWGS